MEAEFSLWDFTAVVYRRGDPASFVLAAASLLPQLLVVFLLGALTFKPTKSLLMTLWVTFFNECINVVLKKVIKEPRPMHPAQMLQQQRSDHGMPSRHAQFVACFTMWCMLMLATNIKRRGPTMEKAMVRVFGLTIGAMLVCIGRTYNHYHTVEQVLVGIAVGVCVAVVMWALRRPVLEKVVNLSFPIVVAVAGLITA